MADQLGQQKTAISRDWENREFVEIVSLNMRKLVDFLNKFGPPSHTHALTLTLID
jgi:hypothetical protein